MNDLHSAGCDSWCEDFERKPMFNFSDVYALRRV